MGNRLSLLLLLHKKILPLSLSLEILAIEVKRYLRKSRQSNITIESKVPYKRDSILLGNAPFTISTIWAILCAHNIKDFFFWWGLLFPHFCVVIYYHTSPYDARSDNTDFHIIKWPGKKTWEMLMVKDFNGSSLVIY
jgi:hypothetical protein